MTATPPKPISAFATILDDSNPAKLALRRYMDQYALSNADKDAKVNFISMAPQYRKRFCVPEDAVPPMMTLLNDCNRLGIHNHILELQDVTSVNASGLVFEFTFESEYNRIDFDRVEGKFIRILFRNILTKWIEFSEDLETHYCFYFAPKEPEYDGKTLMFKSTFRIVIPSIILESDVRYFIYHRVWQSKDVKELFWKVLGFHVRSCFKRHVSSTPIPLMGSCDVGELQPLDLRSVRTVEVDNGSTDGDSMVISSFESRFPNIVNEVSINYPFNEGIVEKSHYLPRAEALDVMEEENNDYHEYQRAYDSAKAEFAKRLVDDDDVKIMYDMTLMLSKERFTDLDSWIEIIRSLAASGERYHCIAVMATKDNCKKLVSWSEFVDCWKTAVSTADRAKYSANALRYWAAVDSPSRIHRYVEESIRNMLIADIRDSVIHGRIGHSHIASYLHFMFQNVYITHNVTKTSVYWYEFVTPLTRDSEPGELYKWKCIGDQPDSLSIFISKEFKRIAGAVHNDLKSLTEELGKDSDSKDEHKAKYVKKLYSAFDKAIIQIVNTGFKRSVIDEATGLFKRNYFIKRMDKEPLILGVGNGVIEFGKDSVKLLDYFHTYPISLYTDTKYVPYDESSKYVKTVYKMLNSLVPDDEQDALEFLLYYFSTSLDWLPKESLFFIIHGGGCHAIDTPIRMFDGSIKKVQDVIVGDALMGDDNTSRTVKELFRGTDDMVRILPRKGESFEVNKDHVLSLMFTNIGCVSKRTDTAAYKANPKFRAEWFVHNGTSEPKKRCKTFTTKTEAYEHIDTLRKTDPTVVKKGDIIDIKVKDLMKWKSWWLNKSNLTLYKSSGVSYAEKQLKIDPYMLGYWLGDGTSRTCEFTTEDFEVVDAFKQRLSTGFELREKRDTSHGKAKSYRIVDTRRQTNAFLDDMRSYDVICNKHIPEDYKTSSTEQRLELLAGVLDSDGHYQSSMGQYELTFKSEQLFDDCIELVRSLGFACYKAKVRKTCTNGKNGPVTGTYFRMQICGEGLDAIPCKIARKKASPRVKSKNVLLNSFAIKEIEHGDYYGFELDGNHRYLTGDFYVHHNSNGKSVLLELFRRTLGELYVRKMPLSFITDQNRTRSSSADPAIMDLKDARLVYYSESDRNEKVNVAKVKEITGGEALSGRQLYKEQENFRANCNHIVTTNHRFVIETTEHAVWRRFVSYKFKICFKHEPNPDVKTERKRDDALIKKIMDDKRYQEAFLSILIHYRTMLYANYDGQILKVPRPTILRETEEYRQSEDVYQKYIMQKVYYGKDCPQVTLDEMCLNFREYYQVENNGERYKGKTPDMMATFMNTSIAKHIVDVNGVPTLKDIYFMKGDATASPGAILFAKWMEIKDEA